MLEGAALDIRLISTLTPEDEARYATVFLKLISAVLEGVPVAYALSAELTNGEVVRLPDAEGIHRESPALL